MMGVYDTNLRECTYCGCPCDADYVDVGVGMVQCGPYHCTACGATEIGPELMDWYLKDRNGKTIFSPVPRLRPNHPFSDKELETGWYEPRSKKVSPYANTINGTLVNHKVAKKAYELGFLDDKNIGE
jgi:hypothetical protein